MNKMLTKKDREWVLTGRKRYEKKDTASRRQKDYRIRKKALVALKDLAFLARALSPSQHKQIFSLDRLKPFVKALSDYASTRARVEKQRSKDVVYDEQLFKLGIEIGNRFLGISKILVNEHYREMIWGTGERLLPTKEDINGLTTVYFAIKRKKAK